VMAPAMGNLQAGTLRAMAVLGPTRSSLLPDVPTAAESGLPDFEAMLHYGLLAPARTPRSIVALLNEELRKVVASEDVTQRVHADGGDVLISSPEEYTADIDQEEKKWSALIKKLGLHVD
jgi:tripartite-type tricarboxylate transporter receptor subunit TctC